MRRKQASECQDPLCCGSWLQNSDVCGLLLLLRPKQDCEVLRSACLSTCSSLKPCACTSQNFLYVTCYRGSVLLWWQCNTLWTSGFVDDVIFLHNGAKYRQAWSLWRRKLFTDLPDGATEWRAGVKSAIPNCLVIAAVVSSYICNLCLFIANDIVKLQSVIILLLHCDRLFQQPIMYLCQFWVLFKHSFVWNHPVYDANNFCFLCCRFYFDQTH